MYTDRTAEPAATAGGPACPVAGKFSGVVARAFHEVRERFTTWRERRALARELFELDDTVLADLGLVRGQISYLVKAHPMAAVLLDRMLAQLKVGTADHPLEFGLHEDLYRTCVMCGERRRCKRWLGTGRADESYREFCPNAWVLDRLRAAVIPAPPHAPAHTH